MVQMTNDSVPESPVRHFQENEGREGIRDLYFCAKMIDEDKPVAGDVVNHYDRLIENGLKITAGQLLGLKNPGEYQQTVNKLWTFAVAAHSLHPDENQTQDQRFTSQELSAHRQSMDLLETMIKHKVSSNKLHDWFAKAEKEILIENKRPNPSPKIPS